MVRHCGELFATLILSEQSGSVVPDLSLTGGIVNVCEQGTVPSFHSTGHYLGNHPTITG